MEQNDEAFRKRLAQITGVNQASNQMPPKDQRAPCISVRSVQAYSVANLSLVLVLATTSGRPRVKPYFNWAFNGNSARTVHKSFAYILHTRKDRVSSTNPTVDGSKGRQSHNTENKSARLIQGSIGQSFDGSMGR